MKRRELITLLGGMGLVERTRRQEKPALSNGMEAEL
jgi:hypothetical protein